ncbi:MAG: hypothetical protein QM808_03055 [Steroidobacteraceae bacterium]
MTAFNVVRFKVKAGNEQKFIDAHRNLKREFKGFLAGNLVKTGDQTFCMVGEWRNFKALAAARPQMIGVLDSFRDLLEDLGGGLGVTDPVSGEVVLKLRTSVKAKPKASKTKAKVKTSSKAKRKAKKPAKKAAKKK